MVLEFTRIYKGDIMKYTVSLYDKDNDYFKDILKTNSLMASRFLQLSLNLILSQPDIVLRRNDTEFGITHNEPFDECQIWDTETNKIVII